MSPLKTMQSQILGAALIELLYGELSEETIAAVDSLKREDIPEPLNNLVGYMHGMSTHPPLMERQITSLIEEIRIAAEEMLEKRRGEPALDTWRPMQSFFFDIFENNHLEDMIEEEIEMLPNRELVPEWAAPLIDHTKTTKARHKELILELLDVFDEIIQKRRAELS